MTLYYATQGTITNTRSTIAYLHYNITPHLPQRVSMSIMYHVITVLNKKIYITIETIKQQKFPFTNQQYASKDVTDLETLALTNKWCKKQYCKLK